jgi:hypothetical protein
MFLMSINLWLDDVRPAPIGWVHAKTVEEAQEYLKTTSVELCSLDHDLGACNYCLAGRSAEQWLVEHHFQSMPNCEHFGTGLTLVRWMCETGHWPAEKPTVHSSNKDGRAKMQHLLDEHYDS